MRNKKMASLSTRQRLLFRVSRFFSRRALFVSLILLFVLCTALPSPSQEDVFYFLSIGDFGTGSKAQKEVAKQMDSYASKFNPKFVLSLGDNIYSVGVKGINDPLFNKYFEDIYSYPSLQLPWYMALGDHDHCGDVQAQISYSNRSNKWIMESPYYVHEVDLGNNEILQIIVTDSIGLEGVVALDSPEDRRFYDMYNMSFVGHKAGMKQLKWLEKLLADTSPHWRIVVGHRPILTCAKRNRFPVEERIMPVLKSLLEKHHVDVYMSGHDHIGQFSEENGIYYIGNGVGGYGKHPSSPIPQTKWVNDDYNGFVLHKVTRSKMEFSFIDTNGKVLHKTTLNKNKKKIIMSL